MNNSFSLQQIQKASNLDANLISRQYKLNLMADFLRVKYENPKLRQSEIANQLGYSSSTLQKYRMDVNMVSPYRINPNNNNKRVKKTSNTNFDNNSHHDPDHKRPQVTSNENGKKVKTKNNLKGGFVHNNIEINEIYSDKNLDNKNS